MANQREGGYDRLHESVLKYRYNLIWGMLNAFEAYAVQRQGRGPGYLCRNDRARPTVSYHGHHLDLIWNAQGKPLCNKLLLCWDLEKLDKRTILDLTNWSRCSNCEKFSHDYRDYLGPPWPLTLETTTWILPEMHWRKIIGKKYSLNQQVSGNWAGRANPKLQKTKVPTNAPLQSINSIQLVMTGSPTLNIPGHDTITWTSVQCL